MDTPIPLTKYQHDLVNRNVGLAQKISHEYVSKSTEIELEEVVAIAYQGLVQAAIKFDPGRETIIDQQKAFGGFARRRIIGAILDWQRGADHVQRSYRRIFKSLVAAGWGTTATSEEELAVKVGVTSVKVKEVLRAIHATPISMDIPPDETWEAHPYPTRSLATEQSVESSAIETAIKGGAVAAYYLLPELQQVIIALNFFNNMELQAIAGELGIGLTVVREARDEAILNLKAAAKSRVEDNT